MKRKDRIDKNETPEILARRTEKMWRHEDREITTSYSLWNIIFAIHAALIGTVGIFIGNDKFPLAQIFFPYVFFVSLIAMIFVVILFVYLRKLDTAFANHFRAIHQGSKWMPIGFDKAKSNGDCKKCTKNYHRHRRTIEFAEVYLFAVNITLFAIIVFFHA